MYETPNYRYTHKKSGDTRGNTQAKTPSPAEETDGIGSVGIENLSVIDFRQAQEVTRTQLTLLTDCRLLLAILIPFLRTAR